MMRLSIDHIFEPHKEVGILFLRLFIGARLLYGVLDNVFSWARMVEFSHFLAAQGLPMPLASAIVSMFAQLIAGLMILTGFRIRWAAALMILNFIVAVSVHIKMGDSVEGMTPALAMLFGSAVLLFLGAGKAKLGD
jgi:putative oxidoreductase